MFLDNEVVTSLSNCIVPLIVSLEDRSNMFNYKRIYKSISIKVTNKGTNLLFVRN